MTAMMRMMMIVVSGAAFKVPALRRKSRIRYLHISHRERER